MIAMRLTKSSNHFFIIREFCALSYQHFLLPLHPQPLKNTIIWMIGLDVHIYVQNTYKPHSQVFILFLEIVGAIKYFEYIFMSMTKFLKIN